MASFPPSILYLHSVCRLYSPHRRLLSVCTTFRNSPSMELPMLPILSSIHITSTCPKWFLFAEYTQSSNPHQLQILHCKSLSSLASIIAIAFKGHFTSSLATLWPSQNTGDICVYAYICVCIYVYVYTYVCMYICVCVYIRVYLYMCVYMYVLCYPSAHHFTEVHRFL